MGFFSVGDVVTVRHDPVAHSWHYKMEGASPDNGYIMNREMAHCAGKQLTIAKKHSTCYLVKEINITDGNWYWTDEMFEEYVHPESFLCDFKPASGDDLIAFLTGVME